MKLARLQQVQQVIEASIRSIGASRVGTVQRILVEGPSRKDASELAGRMVDVRITETNPHSLRGAVLTQ